jgi:hypothetical protein
MAAVSAQHRQFKTLIILVLAMTGGTFLLFGIARITPVTHVTPLRAEATPPRTWTQVVVRSAATESDKGFFHWRIDEDGRLYQTDAWDKKSDPSADGTIQVLISTDQARGGITSRQSRQLTRLLSDLQSQYGIAKDRVHVQ